MECSDTSSTIQTEPVLNENTLARNFNGLKLSIKFLLVGNQYLWTHFGLTQNENNIYTSIALCANSNANNFQVTCQKISCTTSTYIKSSLTINFPLDKDITFAVVQRAPTQTQLASIHINVRGKLSKIIGSDYIPVL